MPHHVWEGRLTTVPGLDLDLGPVLAQEFGGVHDMGYARGERFVQGVSARMVLSLRGLPYDPSAESGR